MKKGIHPKYNKCIVKCVCGNTFETESTLNAINIEVCSACHPIYTGQKKIVDSTGRVDRYNKLLEQKKKSVRSKKEKRTAKSLKKIEITETVKNES